MGSAHDSRVLRSSHFINNYIRNLHEGYHIVGDKSYRSFDNILIPGLSENNEIVNFTYELGCQIIRIQNCFGLFKNKFKTFFFYVQYNGESEKFNKIIVAGVIIHNLIINTSKYK